MSTRLMVRVAAVLCVVSGVSCYQPPRSPYERSAAEARILRRDIKVAVEKIIAQANTQATLRDDVTYVQIKELKRVVFFVPSLRPHMYQKLEIKDPQWIVTPPENAVPREWTDRFVLAQQLSYRYRLKGIKDIQPGSMEEVPFVAKVLVELDISKRFAIAGTPKDVPQPPAGMTVWINNREGVMFSGGAPGTMCNKLPCPSLPAGKTGETVSDKLADQAVTKMKNTNPVKESITLECSARYCSRKKEWIIYSPVPSLLHPAFLSWSHGLPENYKLMIFNPASVKKTRKAPSKSPSSQS